MAFVPPTRAMAAVVAVSAVAVCLAAATVASGARTPPPLASAFDVPVSCTGAGLPSWAFGAYGEGGIKLQPSLCAAIARAQAGRLQGRVQMGMAALGILMLGHELSHALGTEDRDVTADGEDPDEGNCVGWRLFPWVSWRLGFTHRLTDRLAAFVADAGRAACGAIGT